MQTQEQKILDQLREENKALRDENVQLRDEIFALKHGRTLEQATQDFSSRLYTQNRGQSADANKSGTLKVEDLRIGAQNSAQRPSLEAVPRFQQQVES